MANPNKQNGGDNTPPPAVNPFDELFVRVTYSPSRSDKVNNDRGIKSKKLANATITLKGDCATLHGSVYYKHPEGGTPYIDFTFFGTQFQSSITPVDATAKAQLQEWRDRQAATFKKLMQENPNAYSRSGGNTSKQVDASDLGISI